MQIDVEAAIEAHLGIVSSIAQGLKRSLPEKIQLTDLESAGREALLNALREFRPDGNVPLGAWLRVKVRGAMIDSVKGAPYREACHGEIPAGAKDGAATPEQDAIDADGARRVQVALAKLTGKQRLILRLRYSEGLSERQTARRAHISIEAVKRRRSRAVRKLRSALGSERLSARAIGIAFS